LLGAQSIVQGRETAVLKITGVVDHDKVSLSRIKLKKLGTCADSDVEKIKLIIDNGDGVYAATDRLASSGSDIFTNGTASISLSAAEELSGSAKTIFILLG